MENYEPAVEAPARECTVTELNLKNMQHYERVSKSPPTLSEAQMCSVVEAGGGRYIGVMNLIPGKLEAIVLFISPQTRTTLGLPASRLTVAAVREQLTESNAAFSQASSK
jgi:hypothetical protein